MTPDVNVLVAASRRDHPHHDVARRWLEAALGELGSGTRFTLLPMVIASFLRLVTSARIFKRPSQVVEAVAFIDAVSTHPGVELATLGAEWPRFRALCLDGPLAPNNVPDAWIAAAVLQAGEHLVSFDRDFKALLGRGRFTLLTGDPS